MTDWLDLDSPPANVESTPKRGLTPQAEAARRRMAAQVVAKYGPSGPSRDELAAALASVSKAQRIYLEELLQNGLVAHIARKEAGIRLGKELSRQRVNNWDRVPKYVAARRALGLSLQTALNPHENLLRLEHTLQSALTPRKRFAGGLDTGEMEIDAGAALRGLELAAKINKQLGADVSINNRVTVQILDLTDAEAPDFAKGKVVEGSVEPAPTEEP